MNNNQSIAIVIAVLMHYYLISIILELDSIRFEWALDWIELNWIISILQDMYMELDIV